MHHKRGSFTDIQKNSISHAGIGIVVKALDAGIKQLMQCRNAINAESLIECQLRLFPGTLHFDLLYLP
ncbi:hypothetical protein D9M71_788920 [compost metagenome]